MSNSVIKKVKKRKVLPEP